MPLIRGMGGTSKRTNPLRAFGDGAYLSDYWSNEAPSRHEIRALLEGLSKVGIYQVNYEGGTLGDDGTIRFPTNAEPFTWEADAWCSRSRTPMKFVAWVRNRRDDKVVSLATPGLMRNLVYCLNFFSMFKGVLLDMQWETRDEQSALVELLHSLRQTYPEMSLGLRLRRSWLNHPEMLRGLLELVHDVEVPLYDSAMEGEAYRLWCADETRRAMTVVGPEHLMLGVPARGRTDEWDESLEDALVGVRRGMESFTPSRVRLCVYREGLASDDDWKVFARDWAH